MQLSVEEFVVAYLVIRSSGACREPVRDLLRVPRMALELGRVIVVGWWVRPLRFVSRIELEPALAGILDLVLGGEPGYGIGPNHRFADVVEAGHDLIGDGPLGERAIRQLDYGRAFPVVAQRTVEVWAYSQPGGSTWVS